MIEPYIHNTDLLGFLSCWEHQYQCPLPLVDWFLERGEEELAEAARWAHNQPFKTVFRISDDKREPLKASCYPSPAWSENKLNKDHYWFKVGLDNREEYSDCISPELYSCIWPRGTITQCFINLLDGYARWYAKTLTEAGME